MLVQAQKEQELLASCRGQLHPSAYSHKMAQAQAHSDYLGEAWGA
jgi:hypothetical protein